MRKHHKLQNTVLLSFTILAVVLVLVISLVVGDRYIKGEMENCRTTAYAYTKSAAELIDGDKIAHYLETGEKDEYYYEILDFLNSFRLNTDIQYYYVFVPFENDLVYIWDANALKPDETEVDACELGYHEEAKIIKVHMTYSPFSDIKDVNETDLVCLGDRTVLEDEYVGLDKRIDYVINKAKKNGNPQAEPIILEKKKQTRGFISQIEGVIGMSLDDLMKGKE